MRVLMAEYAGYDSVFKLGSHFICDRFLARGCRVLWLRSYWNVFTPFVAWRGFRSLLRHWSLSPVKLSEGLYGFSPFTLLPYRDAPLFRSDLCGRNALRATLPPLGWWLKRNGWDEIDLLWVTAADLVTLPGLVKHRGLVYRITDNYAGFSHIPAGFARLEEGIIRQADAVIATSRLTFERARSLRRDNTFFMPNAVDLDLFTRAQAEGMLEEIPRPRIVYVGSLEYWFDHGLVGQTARLRPKYQFVLFGPEPSTRSRGYRELKTIPNVHLMGPIPHEKLPGALKESDAAILPKRLDGYTHHSSPLKLYEYLAAGLPVVSTPMQEVAASGAPLIIAGTADEFAHGLDAALAGGRDRAEFLDFARNNSWKERLLKIEEILESLGLFGPLEELAEVR